LIGEGLRMKGKLAVLGDVDFVTPFSVLGVDTFAVEAGTEQVAAAAQKIVDENYTVVVVAEDIAPAAEPLLSQLQDRPGCCVVAIPFTTESSGFATKALSETLRLATGIDILQDNPAGQG